MVKVALITGGARGIGLGIAHQLAAAGWNLMINGVRPANAVQETLQALRSHGVDVDYCAASIGQSADRTRLMDAVQQRFGRLDALINNAGITSPGRKDILEAEEDSFDEVISVNLKGPYFLTQLAARMMIGQGDSAQGDIAQEDSTQADSDTRRKAIVFLSSVSAELPSVNRGDYCISKSAINMSVQLWAARLAEFGIDVFEVRPGIIRSDMTSAVTEKYDRLIAGGLTLERRWGEPADVGKAVRTLVSGDIPYATGQVLRIDGGMTIRTL